MASTYSLRLRFELPGQGEQGGTWGLTMNTFMGTLLEQAVAGAATIALPDGNYTLSTVNGGPDEARNAALKFTGALTAARDVVVPAASKLWVVENATTGGQAIRVKTPLGSGVLVGAGRSQLVKCDGTDVRDAITALEGQYCSVQSLTATAALLTSARAQVVGSFSAFNELELRGDDPGAANGCSVVLRGRSSLTNAGAIEFRSAGVERMRLTPGGQLVQGQAAPWSGGVRGGSFYCPADGWALSGYCAGSSGGALLARVDRTEAALASFYLGSTVVGQITTDGIASYYNTFSDARLKDDLRPLESGDAVDRLRLYDFRWAGTDRRGTGVLAQEAAEVVPQAVRPPADPETGFWSVDYSKLVPLLLAEAQALRARVAALEAVTARGASTDVRPATAAGGEA